MTGGVSDALGGFREAILVRDVNGTTLLTLRLGLPTFNYASLPAISENGRYLAIGTWSQQPGSSWLYFRNLASGGSWNATLPSGVQYVAISADGSTIAAAGPEKLFVLDGAGRQLWSANLADFFAYLIPYPFVAVSSDGSYVAIAGGGIRQRNGYVTLFDRSGKKLWTHSISAPVSAFAMNRDASRIAVGDSSGFIYLLNKSGNLASMSIGSGVRSIAVSESTDLMCVVTENFMNVMDSSGNTLWRHYELPSAGSDVALSSDSERIVAGDVMVLDRNGSRLATLSTNAKAVASRLSSDGSRLVVASVTRVGNRQQSTVSWFDLSSGMLIRNVTLDKGSVIRTLASSTDTGLVSIAGHSAGNFSFVYALDSNGRKLWQHTSQNRVYANSLVAFDYSTAVSGDGQFIAVGSRELDFSSSNPSTPSPGSENSVLLFKRDGTMLWNYSTSNWITTVTISDHGETVAAASSTEVYVFNSAGTVMWTQPVNGGVMEISSSGERFIAGDSTGAVFQGNATGSTSHTQFNGHVESVAISDTGDISLVLLAMDSILHGNRVKLLYVLDSNGRILGNFTLQGAPGSNDHLAIAGNGCCVIVSLEASGIYYYEAGAQATQTTTVETSAVQVSPTGINTLAIVAVIIAAIAGLALVAIRRLKRIRVSRTGQDGVVP